MHAGRHKRRGLKLAHAAGLASKPESKFYAYCRARKPAGACCTSAWAMLCPRGQTAPDTQRSRPSSLHEPTSTTVAVAGAGWSASICTHTRCNTKGKQGMGQQMSLLVGSTQCATPSLLVCQHPERSAHRHSTMVPSMPGQQRRKLLKFLSCPRASGVTSQCRSSLLMCRACCLGPPAAAPGCPPEPWGGPCCSTLPVLLPLPLLARKPTTSNASPRRLARAVREGSLLLDGACTGCRQGKLTQQVISAPRVRQHQETPGDCCDLPCLTGLPC